MLPLLGDRLEWSVVARRRNLGAGPLELMMKRLLANQKQLLERPVQCLSEEAIFLLFGLWYILAGR